MTDTSQRPSPEELRPTRPGQAAGSAAGASHPGDAPLRGRPAPVRHRVRRFWRGSPLPWLAGLLAAYLIAPLVAGVQQAASARWSAVDYPALLHACEVSLASATTATALVALFGIPLGYLLARLRGRAMALLGFVVQLPLALPPLASGVLLLFLVGYDSPLGRLTHGALTDSFAGIVLAEAFVSAPFVIIAARSAFAAMDPAIEDVAATLGRRPLEVFSRVSLPVAGPSLLAGLLLAWLRAFGEFGATVMVAYHPYSLPVYTYVAFGAQGLPAMLPVLLPALVLALAVMALSGTVGARSAAGTRPVRPQTRSAASRPELRTGRTSELAQLAIDVEKHLEGFDLAVAWQPHARRLAVLGSSGSGKSLTLKLIAGLVHPDRATVRIGGRELSRHEPAARAVAYVPQSYGLFPHLDLAAQLRFPVGADRAAAAHWIERLGLAGLEHRRPAELSLGQQQRVALARALVRPADLLLLDEPFAALDTPRRVALRRELLALQGEFAGITLLVTHDPQEAALLADEILILESGRPLQAGATQEVFRRPVSELAARLLGADNAAEGCADGNCIDVGRGARVAVSGPPLAPGRVGWSIPPDRTWISPAGAHEGIVETVNGGPEPQLLLRFGDTHIRVTGGGHLAPGELCRFDIDPARIQVWPLD